MSAIPVFGSPSQEADRATPDIAWWHIGVTLKKTLFLYKTILADAELWLIRDWGPNPPGDGIAMRWQTRRGPLDRWTLRCGETQLAPIVRREPMDASGAFRTFVTNESYLHQSTNPFKWSLPEGRHGFWLELRVGEYIRRSERRYVIRVPHETGKNDEFVVE